MDEEWMHFKRTHGKIYGSDAAEQRHYEAFVESREFVRQHESTPSSFHVGLTRFSDWLEEEIQSHFTPHLASSWNHTAAGAPPLEAVLPGVAAVSQSVDWSSHLNPLGRSVVTSVKDQLQCGACWAFTAAECTESAVAMSTGILESLSVQELIDCDKTWDKGCIGGNPILAFPYIMRNGVAAESSYPFTGSEAACRDQSVPSVSGITGFRVLRPYDEEAMKYWVGLSPVAVGVSGTARSFLLYTGGVYDDKSCGGTLDHALFVVGFGTTAAGVDYWICKNSWGPFWGERGYVRIRRNTGLSEGVCGIAKAPVCAIGGFGGNASDPDLAPHFSLFDLPYLPARSWVEVNALMNTVDAGRAHGRGRGGQSTLRLNLDFDCSLLIVSRLVSSRQALFAPSSSWLYMSNIACANAADA